MVQGTPSFGPRRRDRAMRRALRCTLCGSPEDVHVNDTWARISSCSHAACRNCIRTWIAQSLRACVENEMLRVPCFEPGCRKAMPQRLVLAVSDSANMLVVALEEKEQQQQQQQPQQQLQPQLEAQPCQVCSRVGTSLRNRPCSHVACADCWVDWSAQQLPHCRAARCLNLSCCHPDCREVVDRAVWRRLSVWSPEARACLGHFEEVDAELAPLRGAPVAQEAAQLPGLVCPVCCEQRVALVSAQPECAGHAACADCWVKWTGEQLELCVQQRAPAVRCMFPPCRQAASKELWQVVCGRLDEAGELEKRFARRRRLQDNPFFPAELQVDCPRPGCVGLAYLGYDTSMCFICEHQWVPEDGAGELPATDVEVVMGVAVKKCPKCTEYIEKNGGCDHMTCRCKYEFYWSTLKPYTR
uniref:RING-type domain-containing protein n=1 Tax=Alexandrium monilatum TaxID=311494 RepID=A0A7S4RUE5_9DINO